MNSKELQDALNVLLRRPGIEFVRGLKSLLERDPGYLKAHQDAIIFGVEELLNNAGIFSEKSDLKQNAMNLIGEALKKMQAIEEVQNSF